MMVRFGRVARAVTLAFDVSGAGSLRDDQGVEFMPDMIELRFSKFGGRWQLNSVEIGGPGVNLPQNYFQVQAYGAGRPELPTWAWDFVQTVEVDEELKG